jgi:hypothetical protein
MRRVAPKAASAKFSSSDEPVPVGEDLAPAQHSHRFTEASGPERVRSIERANGIEAVRLHKPQASRGPAGVGVAERSRSSNCRGVSLKEGQMISHVLGAHLGAAFIVLKQNDIEHAGSSPMRNDFVRRKHAVAEAVLSI